MKNINISFLVCCTLLMGCSISAGLSMDSDHPVMHRLALPMYNGVINDDKQRCINGGFVGADINELFRTDRRWGTATNAKVDGGGKRYTFIYFNEDNSPMYIKEWYEHWYQLYDYDLDGKVDECKYYKIYKGKSNQYDPYFDDFVKENKRKSDDYNRRHNLKF